MTSDEPSVDFYCPQLTLILSGIDIGGSWYPDAFEKLS